MKTITPRQLHDRLQQGETLHLLDVRTPAEHAEIHIPAVQLVPLDRLDTAQFASVNGFAKESIRFRRCRTHLRRHHGLVRHGNAHREDALEPTSMNDSAPIIPNQAIQA